MSLPPCHVVLTSSLITIGNCGILLALAALNSAQPCSPGLEETLTTLRLPPAHLQQEVGQGQNLKLRVLLMTIHWVNNMTVHGQHTVTSWSAVACCIIMACNASWAVKTHNLQAIPDASITQYECPDVGVHANVMQRNATWLE
jgi:hypothetical protein